MKILFLLIASITSYAQISISGASINSIPNSANALFWLDGTITYTGGNYYFVDKTGSGRNFLITGYDFSATRGFPYKSLATISAPAGDATLIAADINNYLYTAGVPNQISVVSLFQDVDYEHKLFCRHVQRVTNSNGEEIYEPRVLDIVLYNSILSGTNLTTAQTYYGVPTEQTSNVHWVTKSGSDSNTGTKASPWLTLNKATDVSGVNGYTVYVKSGDYKEDHTGALNGYWRFQKSVNVIFIGRCNVTAYSTGQVIFCGTAGLSHSIKGGVIGNSTATTYVYLTNVASFPSFNFCQFKNANTGLSLNPVTSLPTLSNLIFTGMSSRCVGTTVSTTLDGCYNSTTGAFVVSGATGLTTVTLQYCKSSGSVSLTTANQPTVAVIQYSKSTGGSVTITGGGSSVTNASSSATIKYCSATNAASAPAIQIVSSNFYTGEISNCTIDGGSFIVYEQTNLNIYNNKTTTTSGSGRNCQILVTHQTSTAKTLLIQNNIVLGSGAVAPIQIGDETTTAAYDSWSGTIKNNYCSYLPNNQSPHGIDVFNHKGISLYYNYVKGYAFGMVVKVNGLDLSNSKIAYNVIESCGNGLSTKGGSNQKIFNNTIINPTSTGFQQVYNNLSTGNYSLNTVFKNNIIVETGSVNTSYRAIDNQTGCTFSSSDNNVIYSLNNSNQFNDGAAGSSAETLAQWQALGRDLNSQFTNPNLTAGVPASAILIGDNTLPVNTGLDVTTNFGGGSSLPIIVTKNQPASGSWQVGAYVK